MYVADSLFFIQHFYTNPESDENHGNMFGMRLREIFNEYESENTKPAESAEDIKNRMIEKSQKLSGN